MPDILGLHARAGRQLYQGSEDRLLEVVRGRFPRASTRLVVCDTAYEAGPAEDFEVLPVLSDDREFGAWRSAVVHLEADLPQYASVIISTSAFDKQYCAYLELLQEQWLPLLSAPTAIGHIDCYNEPIVIDGYSSQFWLRTSFVMMSSYVAADALLQGFDLPDDDDLFSDDPRRPLAGDFVSENYKELLISWLTGDGTGQGVTWHRAAPLDEMGMAEFRHKVRAILREHLLTLHLRKVGVAVWDATYLSAQRQPAAHVDWRDQLAGRPRDALARLPRVAVTGVDRRRHDRAGSTAPAQLPEKVVVPSMSAGTLQSKLARFNLTHASLHRSSGATTSFALGGPFVRSTAASGGLALLVRSDVGALPRGNWLDQLVHRARTEPRGVVALYAEGDRVHPGVAVVSFEDEMELDDVRWSDWAAVRSSAPPSGLVLVRAAQATTAKEADR